MAKMLVMMCLCVHWLCLSLWGQADQRSANCWRTLDECRDNPSECRSYLEKACAIQKDLAAELEQSERRKADLEDQLAKAQKQLDELNREKSSAEEGERLKQQIAQFRAERSDLQSENASLQGKVNILESQRNTLIINVEDLSHRKGVFQNPNLPSRAKQIFDLVGNEGPGRAMTCTKNGKKVLITNLVLGTLTTTYDSEITPPSPTRLKFEFEPHSALSDKILGDFLPNEVMAQWYIQPSYQARKLNAKYDYSESGSKEEKRILSLRSSQKETWVWTITPWVGFESDLADIVFYMGYKMTTGEGEKNDVWHQQIEWKEKRTPGLITSAWQFVRSNLDWLLGIISATLAIRLAQLKVKEARAKQSTPSP